MKGKTLGTIVLSLALGMTSVSCLNRDEFHQVIPMAQQSQSQIKSISGKITSIDEDSLAIRGGDAGANFEFEHFRIEATDENTYKLIFPGPSNYQVGDFVEFQYLPQTRVSYADLISAGGMSSYYLWQKGYFDVDGLIQR